MGTFYFSQNKVECPEWHIGGGLLFEADTPGLKTLPVFGNLIGIGMRFNFEEFVRISVDGQFYQDNGNIASRGSDFFEWFSQVQVTRPTVPGDWARTSNYNTMGTGHDWTYPNP